MSKTVFKYRPGLSAVGQYQMSGIPYVSSSLPIPHSGSGPSPYELEFPQVTKFFTIINTVSGTNSPLRVGFSANGVTGSDNGGLNNYFVLDNGESYTAEIRVSKLFLMGEHRFTSASVIAGLTGISGSHLPVNWSGSNGVG
jgi:hypothetical protein